MAMSNRRRLPAPPVEEDYLGDLGEDKGTLNITFGWFGQRIRVNPGAGELELMDFLVKAEDIDVGENEQDLEKSLPAIKAVLDFLGRQIHPDDWDVFYDLAKTHRQSTMDLMNVAMKIVNRVAGFPTGPSGDSGTGTKPTGQKSKDGSSSPDLDLTRRALSLVPATRPDLAMAYVNAFEERTGIRR